MSHVVSPEEYQMPFKLNLHETKLTEEQFVLPCQENPNVRLELTAQGELVIMPPIWVLSYLLTRKPGPRWGG